MKNILEYMKNPLNYILKIHWNALKYILKTTDMHSKYTEIHENPLKCI